MSISKIILHLGVSDFGVELHIPSRTDVSDELRKVTTHFNPISLIWSINSGRVLSY